MTIRISRRLLLAAAALTPAGCSGLLPNGEAPPRLYRLTAADDFPPSSRHVSAQLLVDVPASAAALDTDRIALSRSPTTIDYFADAAWTDRAPLMVQTLLVESFENSGQITAVARESLSLQASDILQSELRHFEADYTGGGPPVARVRIVVELVRQPDRLIAARRSVEASVPAAANEVTAIVDAFNGALHQVLRQIVEWTLATIR